MREKILKLRESGLSYRAIAKKLGMGKTTIEYYCNSDKVNGRQKARRQELKKKLVGMYGGKCVCCGYDRCMSVLGFHHKNSEEKEIAIARHMQEKGITPELIEELKKCILVCRNCHGEIHDGIRDVPV